MRAGSLQSIAISLGFLCIVVISYWLVQLVICDADDVLDYYAILADHHVVSGCQLPQLNAFDSSILPFIAPPKPRLQCKLLQPEFVYFKKGMMFLNHSALLLNSYSPASVKCKYRCIRLTHQEDDVVYTDWFNANFSEQVIVSCETVHVQCSTGILNFVPAYDYIHLQIPDTDNKNSHSKDDPNVVMLVIDSMSRSNALRQLPNAYNYLMHNLSAIDFQGMIKIGDNSFPNALALLTGRIPYSHELPSNDVPYNDWPLIFLNFSRNGYATLYNEDMARWHLFNYYWNNRFHKQPTDLYGRAFWLALQKNSSTMLMRQSTLHCYGNYAQHAIQWRHVFAMFEQLKRPKFALSWTSDIGHECLNTPSIADLDLVDFLRNLKPYLNNTFLFILGDHGKRYHKIRETLVGRYEDAMPFFSIVVPTWFRERYSATLMKELSNNSQRLLSMYDGHATLAEILHQTYARKHYLHGQHGPHGLSLFRPIPRNRTCQDASIPNEFCVCHQVANVPVNDTNVQQAADALMEHINHVHLSRYKQCMRLTLHSVKNAQLSLLNRAIVANTGGHYGNSAYATHLKFDFVVTVRAKPSGAIFEATVVHDTRDHTFTITGDISRLDRYGNQSHCIRDAIVRKFCYCLDL